MNLQALVVDDDPSKAAEIAKVLNEAKTDAFNVHIASDIIAAKQALIQSDFDLVVLDIALPRREGEDVRPFGGLELVDHILRKGAKAPPEHIVGITAHEDLFAVASDRFSRRLLTILHYDPLDHAWKGPLRSRAEHIIRSRGSSDDSSGRDFSTFAAIITALDIPELVATRRLSYEWHQSPVAGDHTIYYEGSFGEERLRVVAASAGRKGMVASAVLASKVISHFRPRIVAMLGISAGIPGRTSLGDVVVAEVCWDWGSGKVTGTSESKFAPAPYQLPASQLLVSTARHLALDQDLIGRIRSGWAGAAPPASLRVHIGPVASGASVIADEATRTSIVTQHRELLGIEMEAYGVYAAADQAAKPRPEVISIKSVVDYADATKNDNVHQYAAYTSTAFLHELLKQLWKDRRAELGGSEVVL